MKKAVAGLVLGAGALVSGQALADVNGSVAASSDYMFRGIDSSNGAAIQGSLTWNNPTGFYVGGWASNTSAIVRGGNEFDAYAGWSSDLGNGVNLDLGAIYYVFTEDKEIAAASVGNLDFPEIYIGASFGGLTGKVFYAHKYFNDGSDYVGAPNKDQDSVYTTLSYTVTIQEGLNLAAQVGYSAGDGVENLLAAGYGSNDDNYWDYSLTLTKNLGDGMAANFAVVDTDIKGNGGTLTGGSKYNDKPKFVVSFSKAFNL